VGHVIANSGTRYGALYAPADEVLQSQRTVDTAARNLASGGGAGEDAFGRSRERFEQIVGWLDAPEAAGLEHGEPESRSATATSTVTGTMISHANDTATTTYDTPTA
jgi:hypothetical protein